MVEWRRIKTEKITSENLTALNPDQLSSHHVVVIGMGKMYTAGKQNHLQVYTDRHQTLFYFKMFYLIIMKNACNFVVSARYIPAHLPTDKITMSPAKARISPCLLLSAIVSILFLLFFSIPVQAGNPTAKPPLIVRVGAYENNPKIYTDKSGNIVGLFPDVLDDIARKEGWQIQYVHGSWTECLNRLKTNEIDMMVDVAYSKKRAQDFAFNNETFLVNWATVYSSKNEHVDSLVDLKGKKVAVMKGSIHTEGEGGIINLLARFDIPCTYIKVESYADVFRLVSTNKADVGVVNRIFGSVVAKDYHVEKTPIIFNPSHLKFAFPKNSPLTQVLIAGIDRDLRELKKAPDSIYNRALYVYLSGLPREAIYVGRGMGTSSQKIVLTESQEKWIKEHPVIRVGIDPEFAPFEFFSPQGQYRGIASDYVRILNERLGLNLQVVKNLTWPQVVAKVDKKEIDVLSCIGITKERKKNLLFSRSYINFHRVIISRLNEPFVTGINDLEDAKVAVQQNSSHEGYLREHTNIKPIAYQTLKEALSAVSDGQARYFVGNIASSTYWIRKLNLTNLKVAAPVSSEIQNLYFGIRSDWPELVSIINKGLASINQDEENTIRKKWVNVEYAPGLSPRLVFNYALQIAGGVLIMFMLFLAWNYRLKREINKRIVIEKKLHKANVDLKNLDRLKSMFIASMSHELRTPLNSIIGFTGIILQGMTGPLNDKQKDHLSRVYNSSKHLLALITDVIDISKIEAGRIDIFPEEVLLAEIVEEAAVNIQPQLKVKNLSLDISIPHDLVLLTDRKRLLQCIINYLSNAVKFTEAGGIRLVAERKDETAEIRVSDTGIGIPEKDMGKLFEAFERLDTHLRVKAGGTGLGLYLTKKLVTEILGGEIFVTSKEGEGSTFGLCIPMRHTAPEALQEVREEATS